MMIRTITSFNDSQRRRFFALFLGVPWLAISFCVVAGALWPAAASNLGGWILLFSGVAFGMPHGACDVWAMQQAVRCAKTDASSTRFRLDMRWLGWMSAYVGSAVLMLLLWRVNSALALLVFLVLTMWHFGSADAWLHSLMLKKSNKENSFSQSISTLSVSRRALSWGRGLLVIGAPLVFQSAATQTVLGRFVALSGAHDATILWRIAPCILGFGLILQSIGHFLLLRSQNESTSSTRSSNRALNAALWIETLGLLILFAVAPPLLAVACYFLAVHAWRHMVRLEIFGEEGAQKNAIFSASVAEIARGVWRQHRGSFVLTLVALLGIVPIWQLWPSLFSGGIAQWNTAYLVLISTVTVPHVTVVSWLEARHDL